MRHTHSDIYRRQRLTAETATSAKICQRSLIIFDVVVAIAESHVIVSFVAKLINDGI